MLPVESITTFTVASILLALAPGPDNLFVLTQSSVNGYKAGLFVTLGLCTGLIVHTSAVALGITALLQASAVAFTMLKLAGALYLLYLAWQAFHASGEKINIDDRSDLNGIMFYFRGVIMNVTNPKVSIFFLAFLPQFADPANGTVIVQIVVLGALFILVTLLVFGCIALLSGTIGSWLISRPRTQIIMNRLAGIVFVAMAFNIATVTVTT